jgi:hypothetical protein
MYFTFEYTGSNYYFAIERRTAPYLKQWEHEVGFHNFAFSAYAKDTETAIAAFNACRKLRIVLNRIYGYQSIDSAVQKRRSLCHIYCTNPDEKESFYYEFNEKRRFVGLFISGSYPTDNKLESQINAVLTGPDCEFRADLLCDECNSSYNRCSKCLDRTEATLWRIYLELISDEELHAVLQILKDVNIVNRITESDYCELSFYARCCYSNLSDLYNGLTY